MRIDPDTNAFLFRDRSVRMTPIKADLMRVLLACRPRTAPHDHIIMTLWGQAEPDDARNNLKVFVSQINTKLADVGVRIECVRGVGYRIIETEK